MDFMRSGSNPFFNRFMILVLLLSVVATFVSFGQDSIEPAPQTSLIFASPQPFTLDSRAAQTCIDILRAQMFILVDDGTGASRIVKVKTVWAEFRGIDDQYPPGFQGRFEVILNGESIDWRHSSIEYNGEMVNLQMLFTYRNQYPPAGLEYRPEEFQ